MGSVATQPAVRAHRRWRRPVLVALAIVAVAATLAVGHAVMRYGPALEDVRLLRTEAAALSDALGGLGPGDIDAATIGELRDRVRRMDGALGRIEALLATDAPVGVARGLPGIRDQVIAADHLAAAGRSVLAGADLALDLGDRFARLRKADAGGGRALLSGLVALMAGAREDADRLAGLLDDAQGHLDAIPSGAAPQIAGARDELAAPLARYRPLLDEYRRLDDRLPEVLGWGGERRYLVLAQNPAELRPTGGFVGTIGWLVLHDGALAEMRFEDVYVLDDQLGLPYQEPPPALESHLLNRSSWELADANWSPDFPTSAADALRLYTVESGDDRIDGVIAITTFALDRLLEVLGPVAVPDHGVTVRPGEVTVTAIAQTRGAGPDRKRFLGRLADTTLERLLGLPPGRWNELAQVAERVVDERLVLAWFRDPRDQAAIRGTPLAGEVLPVAGDYVSIVDANVAPSSKLSLVVRRESDLRVSLLPDGTAHHALRTTWHNDSGRAGEPYQTLRDASESSAGQYGVYSRLLVPADSELVEAVGESVLPVSGIEDEEPVAGRLSWGNFLLVDPGSAWLAYEWISPGADSAQGGERVYRLTVQKQPGVVGERMSIAVKMPEGATVLGASPGVATESDTATWLGVLERDVVIVVRYTP